MCDDKNKSKNNDKTKEEKEMSVLNPEKNLENTLKKVESLSPKLWEIARKNTEEEKKKFYEGKKGNNN